MEETIVKKIENCSWNKKLQICRILQGATQKEMANKIGADARTYWVWEKGHSYPSKLSRKAICNAFNIEESEIFGG